MRKLLIILNSIRPGGDTREVSNDLDGIAALVAQMRRLNPVALVMEAPSRSPIPIDFQDSCLTLSLTLERVVVERPGTGIEHLPAWTRDTTIQRATRQ